MGRTKVTRTLSATLRPLSTRMRSKVLAAYRPRVDRPAPLNDVRRRELSEAIFEVENDLEHRQHDHPQVAILRAVRNILLDDIGENETWPSIRWSHIEAVAALMVRRPRRRTAPTSPLFAKKASAA